MCPSSWCIGRSRQLPHSAWRCSRPAWIAYQLGCTLVQIKTEAERQLELERARSAKLADENALLRSLVQRAAA